MKLQLPTLDYDYDALEPYLDEETMRIHHTRHHQKYVDNFNEALKNTKMEGFAPEEIFHRVSEVPEAVARNGGQAYNHSFFWKSLSPAGDNSPDQTLEDEITAQFESLEKFRNLFFTFAAANFGSGWTWLIMENGRLKITSTSNHINPLMDIAEDRGIPLLCIDIWEHAYYLKYRNRRADYIKAFWEVINWEEVNRRFQHA